MLLVLPQLVDDDEDSHMNNWTHRGGRAGLDGLGGKPQGKHKKKKKNKRERKNKNTVPTLLSTLIQK